MGLCIFQLWFIFLIVALFVLFALPSVSGQSLTLSGKVILEDGSPPPEPVKIELICDNEIQPQALTQSDGGFSFRVGGNRAFEVHASSAGVTHPSSLPRPAGSRGFYDMTHCEVRGFLAGYRSSKIQLGRRNERESPDIGVIVLYPQAESQGPMVSLSTLRSPEKALEAYQKAQKELAKEDLNPKKASEALLKAIEEYPQFSAAWNLLAEARIHMDDLEGAREALRKAIETDPNYATPCVTLALLELKQGNTAGAAEASEKAIRLAPEHAESRYYHAMAMTSLGDLIKSEESLRVVLTSPEANRFPRAHFLLGSVLAQKGQLKDAAAQYQRYLELESNSRAAVVVRQQLEQWQSSGLIQ